MFISTYECEAHGYYLDKQRICINKQSKSLKKKLKLNVCIRKSNSAVLYAIICDVHLVSIWVINRCQSGIDFFLPASAHYNSNFMNKIFAKCILKTHVNKGTRFASGTIKSASFILYKGRRWE